jgi:biotin carboxylase
MRQRHVLMVGGVDFMVAKVQKLGLRFSMMQVPERVDERHSLAAERYTVMDYTNLATTLPMAKAWHSADPFDAVVSFTEYGLEPASRCARELGVPGDNLQAVLATRDKTTTRELLDRHGLSPVRYRVCADLSDAAAFLAELPGGSMVLKPCDRGLSEGVVLVRAPEQLTQAWAWSRAVTDGPILAEEFLDGPEFSVESLSLDGEHVIVMITEKVTTELPRFIELGHQLPARLPTEARDEITELVTRLLVLVGQRTGPAHTEIRLTAAGPRIIESQTRAGGDQIWELCQMVTGIDLIGETVAALVALPMPPRTPVAKAAAIRYFGYENARILDVRGIAEAAAAAGVVRIACALQPGHRLGELTSSDSRQGYVIAHGDSTDQAVANAERARDTVEVTWRPTGGVG